jgi:beta-glucosidase
MTPSSCTFLADFTRGIVASAQRIDDAAASTDPTTATYASPFPADFVFGVAAASAQIDDAAFEHGKGESIWDPEPHADIWRRRACQELGAKVRRPFTPSPVSVRLDTQAFQVNENPWSQIAHAR